MRWMNERIRAALGVTPKLTMQGQTLWMAGSAAQANESPEESIYDIKNDPQNVPTFTPTC